MSHWVSHTSPWVPRKSVAAPPAESAVQNSISSYSALKARQKHTTRNGSQRLPRSGERRMKISRASIAGMNPCAKWPIRS